MELAWSFQCFGIVFFVVAKSATFFNDVDFAIIFSSTLAPVITAAITPLITLVMVVAKIVVLVAAIKIVIPTMVAAVVVVVWGWSERGTLVASSMIIFLASSVSAYF
jgi:hypothetical protein